MDADRFVLGVNYWPRRSAMGWWSNFDAGEVDEDFALLADLGMDVVRVFLLWDDWQPTPDTVSPACLGTSAAWPTWPSGTASGSTSPSSPAT
jgi:hypothetical protein